MLSDGLTIALKQKDFRDLYSSWKSFCFFSTVRPSLRAAGLAFGGEAISELWLGLLRARTRTPSQ